MTALLLEQVALEQEAEDFAAISPFDLADRDPAFVARFRAWWEEQAAIETGEPLEVDDVSDPFPPL